MKVPSAIQTGASLSASTLDDAYAKLLARRGEGKGVTTSCVNALIAACGKAKEMGRAFETFEVLGELDLEPDIHTYTLLMDICLTNRRFDAVLKMAEEIEARNHAPPRDPQTAKRHAEAGSLRI